MTKAQEVYASTINLLGSDVPIPELQQVLDAEHATADPVFARELAKRRTLQQLIML